MAAWLLQIGGDPNKAIKAYCKKINQPVHVLEDRPRLGHFFGYENHKNGVIWFHSKKDISTICHECFHAAYHLLTHCGIPLKEDTEEVYAYYQGYLVKEVLK